MLSMNHKRIIPPSELPVTEDGRVYHLNLHPDELADNIILVGDPGRVDLIARFFDHIEFREHNRELKTITGTVGNTRISAVSTGMGTDNLDIVITELDACANIDLSNRTIKEQHRSLRMIRLGTSGALNADIGVDSFVASDYVIGIDGVLHFYEHNRNIRCTEMEEAFIKYTRWNAEFAKPYALKASSYLLNNVAENCHNGITITANGFYGPQGRFVRLPLAREDMNHLMETFSAKSLPVLNYEMETSALYGLGQALGHETLTICVIIANRLRGEFSSDYHSVMKKLIEQTLSRICNL